MAEKKAEKDITKLSERMDNFSEKMRTIIEGFQNQIKQLNKNQETLVTTLAQMRGQTPPGQTGQPGQKNPADARQTLGLVRDIVAMGKGNQPNIMETYLTMMLREGFLMQRTLRLGMMKRMNIEDLLTDEEKSLADGTEKSSSETPK